MAFDRRSMLLGTGASLALLGCNDEKAAADAGPGAAGEAAVLPTLAALADRLLPADENGPGARAAGVEAFLAGVLQDERLSSVHPLLRRGAAFLLRAAQAEHQRSFVDLTAEQQDDLIRRLAENKMRPDGFQGPTFVRIALALTLEGTLGDPRHGGNKDQVGWKVVGFSPDGRAAGLKVMP